MFSPILHINCLGVLIRRILLTLCFFQLISGAYSQQLTFKLDHPRLIRSGNKQLLRYDVLMKASDAGTFLYASQIAFSCNANVFVNVPITNIEVTKGFISGTYNGNQKYVINSATWNGNNLAIGISANTSNNGSNPSSACAEVTTNFQVLVSIGLEISNPNGTAGLIFKEIFMQSGPGGLQQFALNPLPAHGFYTAPNLFEGDNFQTLYLGRIFSASYNWSQFGGQTNDVTYLDWSLPVNTSVWDSTGFIDSPGCVTHKLRIHNTAQFIINPGAQLNCFDSVDIDNAQGLWIKSAATYTGSFIDNGDITCSNGGSAVIERYLTQDRWHGYCIPVKSTNTHPFVDLQMLAKWYDEPEHIYHSIVNPAGDSILNTQMLGYFVYSGSALNPNSTISVTGTPNTGEISFPVSSTLGPGGADGWNLTGNPYPSGALWTSVELEEVDPVMYIFDPQRGNYIFWNSMDATHTTNMSPVIPPMQGFYVHCHAPVPGSGSITINNSARAHDNTAFYKSLLSQEDILVLSANGNGFRDEAQIWFSDSSTVFFDPDHDAYKLWGDELAPQLYSELPDSTVAMLNVLPWPDSGNVVPMGFRSGIAGTDTIMARNVQSFPDTIPIWIQDLKEDRLQDLRLDSVYIFQATPADDPDRFRIFFMNPVTGITREMNSGIQIYSSGGTVYVKKCTNTHLQGEFVLFDMTGRQVFSGLLKDLDLNRFVPGTREGLYIARVNSDRISCTKRVFLR